MVCVAIVCWVSPKRHSDIRREFFEQNGVPNFEEYDKEQVPDTNEFFHRLRFLVYKFKSEKGYNMWISKTYNFRGIEVAKYSPELFADIE